MIKYKAGRKYQLIEPAKFPVPELIEFGDVNAVWARIKNGVLYIEAMVAWDGPSGPAVDTRSFMQASLVHDMIYRMIRQGFLPPEARKAGDTIMYRICREDGMYWWRAWRCWWGVSRFAEKAATEPTEILIAP